MSVARGVKGLAALVAYGGLVGVGRLVGARAHAAAAVAEQLVIWRATAFVAVYGLVAALISR